MKTETLKLKRRVSDSVSVGYVEGGLKINKENRKPYKSVRRITSQEKKNRVKVFIKKTKRVLESQRHIID